jgi:hypothetical protein
MQRLPLLIAAACFSLTGMGKNVTLTCAQLNQKIVSATENEAYFSSEAIRLFPDGEIIYPPEESIAASIKANQWRDRKYKLSNVFDEQCGKTSVEVPEELVGPVGP